MKNNAQQTQAVERPLFFQGKHKTFFIWWAILFGFLILQLIFAAVTFLEGVNIVKNGLNVRHVQGQISSVFGAQKVEMDIVEQVSTGYNVLSQGENYTAKIFPSNGIIIIGLTVALALIVLGVWALAPKKQVETAQKWLLRAITLFALVNLVIFGINVVRQINYVQEYVDGAPAALAKMKELVEKSGGVLEITELSGKSVSLSKLLEGDAYPVQRIQQGGYNLDIAVEAKTNVFALLMSAVCFLGAIVATSKLKKINKSMKSE